VTHHAVIQGFAGLTKIDFGYTLAAEPTVRFIPANAAPPAGCSGTPQLPGADPGYLCVFEETAINRNAPCVARASDEPLVCDRAARYGAIIFVSSTAAGSGTWSMGTWALTQ
jgi:hypothetical protein